MQTGLRRWLFLLCIILFTTVPARAQTGGTSAALYPPETDKFPTIITYLDVRDEQGHFIPGLAAGDVRILENSLSQPVTTLNELHPGTQFVVALAPGPAFGIRDGLGQTRFSYIAAALETWAKRVPANSQDDLSLLIAGGAQVIHTASASEWLAALQTLEPDPKAPQPTLQVLSQAVDTAETNPPRLGMGRAVLFITAPQPAEVEAGLQNLVARAAQQGVRVFVWFVATPDLFDSPGAGMLQNAALQTGGEFFTFSRDEAIPDIETYLSPLRSVYQVVYTSRLTTSGKHEIAAEVNTPALQVISPSRTFDLTVSPPNPIFVSPPINIIRSEAEISAPQGQPTPEASTALTPNSQLLNILVEFPDGHPRLVVTATLYVDGVLAMQNTQPPLEQFTWDLTPYEQSGSHKIRAEVTDSLGLSGSTIELPIEIKVQRAQVGVWTVISQQGALVIGVIVVLAGMILGLVLILGGKIRPKVYGKNPPSRTRPLRSNNRTRPLTDPLLRPITPQAEKSRLPAWFRWSQRPSAPTALAVLTPISDNETPHSSAPIPLNGGEITLGNSPAHAQIVLDDPSVANLHTRLQHESHSFRVSDAGSVAGTWVNYVSIGREGTSLAHGDVLHIGRLGFRFTLRQPKQTRKPIIRKEQSG